MRYVVILIWLLVMLSCMGNPNMKMTEFRTGTFKTVLEDSETVSYARRNDSIQIEDFNGARDTFDIKWLDQFEYVLTKRHPKTQLDSTPFHVKITSVKENQYSFSAYYKGSNFKQKGTAEKIK